MPPYLPILKRTGTVLIAIGLLDIGYMIYCLANKQSYSSSFNILAVIGGIFLRRGSLKATRIITFFIGFFLTMMGAALISFLLTTPPGLAWAYLTLRTFSVISGLAICIAVFTPIIWIYRSLTQDVVLEAFREADLSPSWWSQPSVF